MDQTRIPDAVEKHGFAIVPECLDVETCRRIIQLLDQLDMDQSRAIIRRKNKVYAVRDVLNKSSGLKSVLQNNTIRRLIGSTLGRNAFVVRSILFDKTASANWHVGWHQDLMIPVKCREDVQGYSAWSVKAGVTHVKPPCPVLEQMLTLRIHLDECTKDDGPLRVIPESHVAGELTVDEIRQRVNSENEVHCVVPAGGALLMKPLLLHASSRANSPDHRRVLHLELANEELPDPLKWHEKQKIWS